MTQTNSSNLGLNVLCLIVFLYGLVVGMVVMMVPLYAASMGANQFEIGIIVSIYGVMYVLSSPLIGRASDRFGKGNVLVLGMVGYIVCMFFFAIASRPFDLALVRVWQGIIDTPYWIIPVAMMADSYQRRLGSSIGRISAFQLMGVSLGPLAAGLMIRFLGYPHTFYLCALIMSLTLATAFLGFRGKLFAAYDQEHIEQGIVKPTRRIIQLCVAVTIDTMCFGIIVSQLVLFATKLLGSEVTSGALFTAFFVINAAIQAPVGRLWEVAKSKHVVLTSFSAIMGLSFFSLAFMVNVPVLVIATFLLSLCEGAIAVVLTISIMEMAPLKSSGFYSSLQNTAWGAGYFLGPLVGGFLALQATEMAFLFAGVISLAMLGILVQSAKLN